VIFITVQKELFYNMMLQQEKENYIADMLVRTLYSNDIDSEECYHIIELFNKKVLEYYNNQ